jgi:hypothetical protein
MIIDNDDNNDDYDNDKEVNHNTRLIDYLRFYVPLKNISLIRRRHHCR